MAYKNKEKSQLVNFFDIMGFTVDRRDNEKTFTVIVEAFFNV